MLASNCSREKKARMIADMKKRLASVYKLQMDITMSGSSSQKAITAILATAQRRAKENQDIAKSDIQGNKRKFESDVNKYLSQVKDLTDPRVFGEMDSAKIRVRDSLINAQKQNEKKAKRIQRKIIAQTMKAATRGERYQGYLDVNEAQFGKIKTALDTIVSPSESIQQGVETLLQEIEKEAVERDKAFRPARSF